MRVGIREVAGENCITIEAGEEVYDVIHPELSGGSRVELDFAGVRVFASPFFNAAIGRLVEDLDAANLNRLLTVVNLAPDGRKILDRVIENAREYYGSPWARKAIDAILHERAENF